jgi:ribosomal protein S18 acetylase RimI-like enzyme
MTYHLHHGLPESYRLAAARLYWQAFGGKLGPVLGPEPRALRFLTRVMRLDHCVAALDDGGRLCAIAGYRTAKGSFAGGDAVDLRAIYGFAGAAWRYRLLAFLADDSDHFLLEGIAVDHSARSQGIGTEMIAALCDLGRSHGHVAISLDVVSANSRAADLYLRLGFVEQGRESMGLLRHIFGFDQVITMMKRLD